MVVSFGFYNSVNGDRKYDAVDVGGMFDMILADGVINNFGGELRLTASGTTGLGVILASGRAWTRKTWTLNDANIAFSAVAADAANPRIDAYVLEVNSALTSRSNTFRWVTGTPAANPVRPTMAVTETLRQYPVAWVLRPAGNNNVIQANITNAIGTADFPYAGNKLLDRFNEPIDMHRNVFRGKYLGSAVTAAQSKAIADQTWDDLYIGDYWEVSGRKYRIVDFNYWLGAGSPENTTPHVVVMPDSNIGQSQWNSTGNTNTGYTGSTIDRYLSTTIFNNIINPAFGSRILEIRTTQVNAASGGVATGDAWYATRTQTPTAIQVYGNTWSPPWRTESTSQFALFRLAPQFIKSADKDATWLRDTNSVGTAALVHRALFPTTASSGVTDTAGVRPTFALY